MRFGGIRGLDNVVMYITIQDYYQAAWVTASNDLRQNRLVRKFARKYPEFKYHLRNLRLNGEKVRIWDIAKEEKLALLAMLAITVFCSYQIFF